MARARNGVNQRGTYGRKPVGPIGKRPTPRTGGGMKLPTKKVRPPKPTDTGGRKVPKKFTSVPKGEKAPRVVGIAGRKIVEPKPTKKVRPPMPTDTGGRVVPKKYKPRLQVDPRKPKRPVQRLRRAAMGNRSRRGLRR